MLYRKSIFSRFLSCPKCSHSPGSCWGIDGLSIYIVCIYVYIYTVIMCIHIYIHIYPRQLGSWRQWGWVGLQGVARSVTVYGLHNRGFESPKHSLILYPIQSDPSPLPLWTSHPFSVTQPNCLQEHLKKPHAATAFRNAILLQNASQIRLYRCQTFSTPSSPTHPQKRISALAAASYTSYFKVASGGRFWIIVLSMLDQRLQRYSVLAIVEWKTYC